MTDRPEGGAPTQASSLWERRPRRDEPSQITTNRPEGGAPTKQKRGSYEAKAERLRYKPSTQASCLGKQTVCKS